MRISLISCRGVERRGWLLQEGKHDKECFYFRDGRRHILGFYVEVCPHVPKRLLVGNGYVTNLSYQNHLFNLISNDKNCSKFNILHTICLKNSKSFSLNPTCWGFPNKTKSTPKFAHNLFFWFKWIFNDKIVQFKNLSTIVQNITKPTWCIPTHQGLSNGIKSVAKGVEVWDISMWRQINYLLS